jgi:chorismate synthase
MDIETDVAEVLSGVRAGATLGTPIALAVWNRDFENWSETMDAFAASSGERVTRPRPGHADLAGVQKTGATDVRDVLERASARETAGRVAAGAVARRLLAEVGVGVHSAVVAIGDVVLESADVGSFEIDAIESSDVRCPDEVVAARMRQAIDTARQEGESLGGVFVVWAEGLVPGLGGYASGEERLDGRLARAVMSIPAIKGVEIGDGFSLASRPGSEAHDEIVPGSQGLGRATNHAGGLEGGMTNGERLVVRAAMKPIPTLTKPLRTVDIATGEAADAAKERSDVCAVPAAAVVAEAETCVVLADAYAHKFGGDAMSDLLDALRTYRDRISR